MGIIAIAGIFALAVLGTAGAFGYRAIFGSSGVSVPPPVIKADTTPSKIVPAATSKDPQANKLITDRLGNRGEGEKLVSREEQPIDLKGQGPPAWRRSLIRATRQAAPVQPVLGQRRRRVRAEESPHPCHSFRISRAPPRWPHLAPRAPAPTASPTRVKSTAVPAPPPAPRATMRRPPSRSTP